MLIRDGLQKRGQLQSSRRQPTGPRRESLAAFYREFSRALLAEGQPEPRFRSLRFSVYRNTSARGTIEALRASYPTVDRLLGEEMFVEVAIDYRREAPPAGPILSEYGVDFSDFLARQPWARELPYIGDVAKLDRIWLESFLAAEPPASKVNGGAGKLMVAPATRFAWLGTPAMTIWQAHRGPGEFVELTPEWREEGALVTRRACLVHAERIDQACYGLLRACVVPNSIGDCLHEVASDFPTANVPAILDRCLRSGALIIR